MVKTTGDGGEETIMEFRIANLGDSTEQEIVFKNRGEIEGNCLGLPTFYQVRMINKSTISLSHCLVLLSTWHFAL